MIRFLYYRACFGTYLQSARGIQDMAEATVSTLVREAVGEAARFNALCTNLEAERQHLIAGRRDLDEKSASWSPGELTSARSRVRLGLLILSGLAVATFILYFGILSSLIDTEPGGTEAVRWGVAGLIAAALAFGGMLITERLMESVYPKGEVVRPGREAAVRAVLWTLLLGAVESAVVLLCAGRHVGASADVGALSFYYGTLLLALLLPLLGGLLYWDTLRALDDYRTAAVRHRSENRISELDAALQRTRIEEQAAFRAKSLSYWRRLHTFRVYKELLNLRKGISEDVTGHFAQSYEAFEREAERRLGRRISEMAPVSERPAVKLHPTEEQHLSVIRTGTGRSYVREEDTHLAGV